MSTEFRIQAGCPRSVKTVDPDAATIDEAVESVFLLDTEDAILVWQLVHIPLGYKYDVGTCLRDIVAMVKALLSAESGEHYVDFPSNTFGARWRLEWKVDRLVVSALDWRVVVGGVEDLLRERSVVSLGKSEFICEWKALLERVYCALVGAGYSASKICEIEDLKSVVDQMPEYGVLYR